MPSSAEKLDGADFIFQEDLAHTITSTNTCFGHRGITVPDWPEPVNLTEKQSNIFTGTTG